MDQNVKSIFEDECGKLVLDSKFVKRLHAYQVGFAHKNEEHVRFFGGNLLGVEVVRFTSNDRDQWFHEILQAHEYELERRLIALPGVNEDWIVSSDTMNLSIAWLSHVLYHAPKLSDKEKHQAMVDIFLILQYKYLTSLLYRYFKFPCDKAVAEATYSQLSYKFDIKKYGNWQALFNARAEEIISDKGIWKDVIRELDNDVRIGKMLADIQGRIRDMMKNIYGVLDRVRKQGVRISSTSSIIEHDGEQVLKDKSKNLLAYVRYLNSIVSDKNSFIRPELETIVAKAMPTMPESLLNTSLVWMSNNYRQPSAAVIEDLLTETLIHSFDYLESDRAAIKNTTDLPGLLSRLRGVYMSSRSTDPTLMDLRKKAESVVHQATGNKNTAVISAVRTGILLYIVLRSFTMKHYSTSVA